MPTDAPPAMVAITMGNTQQIKVPEDVNRVRTLNNLGLIFHLHFDIDDAVSAIIDAGYAVDAIYHNPYGDKIETFSKPDLLPNPRQLLQIQHHLFLF